ncbi:MAG TPA: YjbF family lipoprotein [Rhizomicrobium sp.]|nr:YjbF family lipoprotein [Rhizomicrobium sp.]
MTGRRPRRTLRAIRGVAGGLLALLAASCSSSSSGNTNYSQFYQLIRESLSASFGKIRVTRDQAASVAYASMGYSLDGGNQAMLILATDNGGELLWTSSAHVVIVTRQGRIVRTLGLGHDLSGLTTRNNTALPPLTAAIQAPFTSARLQDFPELGLYGVQVSCRAHSVGRQSIKILGQTVSTTRIDESCRSSEPDWSFTDNFWVDDDSGLVWRSRQHVHPKGGMVETEIFRPPG